MIFNCAAVRIIRGVVLQGGLDVLLHGWLSKMGSTPFQRGGIGLMPRSFVIIRNSMSSPMFTSIQNVRSRRGIEERDAKSHTVERMSLFAAGAGRSEKSKSSTRQ